MRTPAAAAVGSIAAKPNAPRTAPPASISVPSMFNRNVAGGPRHHTPAHTVLSNAMMPMSAPLQNATHSIMIPHQNDVGYYSMPLDDQVTTLATKLQEMQTTPAPSSQFDSNASQQQQQRSNDRLNEIHQFIDTLRNMQQAVSCTADEQQRVKKSRALNALLSMFERIIEDQSHTMNRVPNTDPTLKLSIEQLEQRVQQLGGENQQLQIICQEKDVQLHRMNNELQYSHRELQRLTETNQVLERDVMQAREQCQQEVKRAVDAESVATEAENVRDGLLANYARLSEENVDLQREVGAVKLENHKMVTEFEFCQQEITHLQEKCGEQSQQLQRKGADVVELEKAIVDLNDQVAAQRNALQSANSDRQRLQDALHAAQRKSTTASEQLIKLRDQFSEVRRENDFKRHHQQTQESEYKFVRTKLQEEQERRRELERNMLHQSSFLSSRCKENNIMVATDELRRIASANAELKEKVKGLNKQISDSSRPDSGKSTVEGVLVHDNNAMNRHVNKDYLLPASRSESSFDAVKGLLEPKTDKRTEVTFRPRFQVHAMDEFSFTDVDSIAGNSIRIEPSRFEHTEVSMYRSKTENAHPNLMDYFYSQINRAEEK